MCGKTANSASTPQQHRSVSEVWCALEPGTRERSAWSTSACVRGSEVPCVVERRQHRYQTFAELDAPSPPKWCADRAREPVVCKFHAYYSTAEATAARLCSYLYVPVRPESFSIESSAIQMVAAMSSAMSIAGCLILPTVAPSLLHDISAALQPSMPLKQLQVGSAEKLSCTVTNVITARRASLTAFSWPKEACELHISGVADQSACF